MSASDHLNNSQFSPYVQRMAEIKEALPHVQHLYAETDAHAERLGIVRAYARSSVPVEHLAGLREILTGAFEGHENNGMYMNGEVRVGASFAGTRLPQTGQFTLLHETGHHVHNEHDRVDYATANPGRREAMADNYAAEHAPPGVQGGQFYERAVPDHQHRHEIGWTRSEADSYQRARRRGRLP